MKNLFKLFCEVPVSYWMCVMLLAFVWKMWCVETIALTLTTHTKKLLFTPASCGNIIYSADLQFLLCVMCIHVTVFILQMLRRIKWLKYVVYTVEPVLEDHPIDHKNMVSQDRCGLWWQVQLYQNAGPSARNIWSFRTGLNVTENNRDKPHYMAFSVPINIENCPEVGKLIISLLNPLFPLSPGDRDVLLQSLVLLNKKII